MGLKDLLFINNEEKDKPKKEEVKESINKFPSTETKSTETSSNVFANFGFGKTNAVNTQVPTSTQANPEHIQLALQAYQNGYKGLKQNGYDFQNFYDALSEEDRKNPMAYQMAVRFAASMDKSVTKDKLVDSADFYISKINETHQNYVASGNAKKEEVLRQKSTENQNLTDELNLMEQQLQALQTQMADRKNKIAAIDGKYASKLSEIDSKLAANDIAKNEIVSSLEQVKQGIINNVK